MPNNFGGIMVISFDLNNFEVGKLASDLAEKYRLAMADNDLFTANLYAKMLQEIGVYVAVNKKD